MAMIEVNEITKKYGSAEVLKKISLLLQPGHIYGFVGRNGSGKTVLFKCICGFTEVTTGSVFINGKEIGKEIDIPKNIGCIIETPGFLPGFSGYENLLFLAKVHGLIGKEEIRQAMKLVELDPDNHKHVAKYSLGMRQRLGIAQAIMEDPEILVLDEPFNGLDNRGVAQIRQVLLDLKAQGKLILLASHNSEDIRFLCDEVYEMDQGKVIDVRRREERRDDEREG